MTHTSRVLVDDIALKFEEVASAVAGRWCGHRRARCIERRNGGGELRDGGRWRGGLTGIKSCFTATPRAGDECARPQCTTRSLKKDEP